jgi:2-hydroxy-3-keto-5-methylthiopentenyl-1-phosphate phosphatase
VAERTLVVDFDGTITEEDVLDTIARTFGDLDVYREVDEALDRNGMTLHEVLRREFAPVTASVEEVVTWVLANASIRPGFRELVALACERGWRLVVVSSGFRQFIEPVLDREGVGGVELVANEAEPDPAGWRIRFFDESECETCGEACKRLTVRSVAPEGEVVYVGDGYSDRCAAEDADRVFARRGLEAYLRERGVPFTHFDDFHDVIAGLDGTR